MAALVAAHLTFSLSMLVSLAFRRSVRYLHTWSPGGEGASRRGHASLFAGGKEQVHSWW
jgi:hypothetical protein